MTQRDAIQRVCDGSSWSDFCDRLKEAGEKIIAAAPGDPFDRAEGLRYLSRLTQHFLRSTIDESDPATATLSSTSPKIGLDNPDYVYGSARLSSRYEYRLRGTMNDAHMLGIGTFSGGLGTEAGLIRDGYLTSDQIERDSNGAFEISISREERKGNWLSMGENTNSLSIRQTLLHRREQEPARFELVRTDLGDAPAPLAPESFGQALDRVGPTVGAVVTQFLGWTAAFEAHKHEIRPLDPKLLAVAQGDPNTSYNYGYWELADDEAFVIDLEPPERFDYWNLQLGNHWLESLDFMHHDTHVNHETAVVGPDGGVRIVVSASDPGVPNWLDTAGHRRGALALRWVGASEEPPLPRTAVVKLSELL